MTMGPTLTYVKYLFFRLLFNLKGLAMIFSGALFCIRAPNMCL